MQLGLLGGEKGGLIGQGGLSIIQDENDSNQDSDFYGDEEDKIKEATKANTDATGTEAKNTNPASPNENEITNPDILELMP